MASFIDLESLVLFSNRWYGTCHEFDLDGVKSTLDTVTRRNSVCHSARFQNALFLPGL